MGCWTSRRRRGGENASGKHQWGLQMRHRIERGSLGPWDQWKLWNYISHRYGCQNLVILTRLCHCFLTNDPQPQSISTCLDHYHYSLLTSVWVGDKAISEFVTAAMFGLFVITVGLRQKFRCVANGSIKKTEWFILFLRSRWDWLAIAGPSHRVKIEREIVMSLALSLGSTWRIWSLVITCKYSFGQLLTLQSVRWWEAAWRCLDSGRARVLIANCWEYGINDSWSRPLKGTCVTELLLTSLRKYSFPV